MGSVPTSPAPLGMQAPLSPCPACKRKPFGTQGLFPPAPDQFYPKATQGHTPFRETLRPSIPVWMPLGCQQNGPRGSASPF